MMITDLWNIGTESDKIVLQTSKKTDIDNAQFHTRTKQEETIANIVEQKFNSTYQGSPSKIYNCHGLTFASRRTGIYEDSEIQKILKDEYVEIRSDQIIVGDIALWVKDKQYIHSALVVQICDNNQVFVLSKTRDFKEIVHLVTTSPYPYDIIKYYRITHGLPAILS